MKELGCPPHPNIMGGLMLEPPLALSPPQQPSPWPYTQHGGGGGLGHKGLTKLKAHHPKTPLGRAGEAPGGR